MTDFPGRLRAARKREGLTQEQLGFELSVTKSSVSAWETGQETPSFRLLPVLKRVLGVSLDELLCGEGETGAVAEAKVSYVLPTRNDTEAALLKAFRRLSVKHRKALLALLE